MVFARGGGKKMSLLKGPYVSDRIPFTDLEALDRLPYVTVEGKLSGKSVAYVNLQCSDPDLLFRGLRLFCRTSSDGTVLDVILPVRYNLLAIHDACTPTMLRYYEDYHECCDAKDVGSWVADKERGATVAKAIGWSFKRGLPVLCTPLKGFITYLSEGAQSRNGGTIHSSGILTALTATLQDYQTLLEAGKLQLINKGVPIARRSLALSPALNRLPAPTYDVVKRKRAEMDVGMDKEKTAKVEIEI